MFNMNSFGCNFLVPEKRFCWHTGLFKNVGMFIVTSYGAKILNLFSVVTVNHYDQKPVALCCSTICLSLVEPPYTGDTYEQSPLGVMPTFTVLLFLCVLCVDCYAFGDLGFLIGHSVPSTITLVVWNLALKPSGAKKRTTSRSGHV